MISEEQFKALTDMVKQQNEQLESMIGEQLLLRQQVLRIQKEVGAVYASLCKESVPQNKRQRVNALKANLIR